LTGQSALKIGIIPCTVADSDDYGTGSNRKVNGKVKSFLCGAKKSFLN
jgi:hypothetical protein